MSLKGFHLFFIAVSVALSIFVFVWSIRRYTGGEESVGLLILAGICLVSAIGLTVYGVRVRRKLSYLGETSPHPRLVE